MCERIWKVPPTGPCKIDHHYTEKKAIFGAARLLRLLRCANNQVQEVTTFCFPNVEEKQCIVEINVRWDRFQRNSAEIS